MAFVGVGEGFAQGREAYTAPPVPVDATADSPALAKDKAIAEGQVLALRALLESLTDPADHGRLPQVSAAEAEALVTDFGFADERTAAKRYLATMTVSFNAQGVDQLLAGMGVGHVAPRQAPVLVLPLYRAAPTESPQLWEETNPWSAAWEATSGLSTGMVPVTLPLGDLEDIAAIDATRALSGDTMALSGMGARYGAPDVVTVLAEGQPETGLTITPQGAGLFAGLAPFTVQGGEGAYDRAIATLREALSDAWRDQSLGGGYASGGYGSGQPTGTAPGWGYGDQPIGVPNAAHSGYGSMGTPANGLVVLVRFGTLPEWVDMRRKLQAIPGLQGMNLQAVTRGQAQLQLAYPGTVEDLQRIMMGRGLRMVDAGGFWTLERVAGTPVDGIPTMGGGTMGSGAMGSQPEEPAHGRIQGVN